LNQGVSDLIEHLCANPAHQPPEDVTSPVIMYADRWGYCPAGAVDGHDWRATGGHTLATVRDWLGRPGHPTLAAATRAVKPTPSTLRD
jgi:hypothetical protein